MNAAVATPARLSGLPFWQPGRLLRLLRLVLALGIGGLCYWVSPSDFSGLTRLVMGWDGFVISVLLLNWMTIIHVHLADMKRIAESLHPNKTWLLLLLATFLSTTISMVAVMLMLHGLPDRTPDERIENIAVSVVAIGSTWCLMHTLFALHYAHTYFSLHQGPQAEPGQAGLLFPGGEPTSYWDFAYFSFVVGMTAQTADITITSLRMRQLVLFHSLMAFAFNTTIVALTINILAGLL
jgi:uncharacterized membrane protein